MRIPLPAVRAVGSRERPIRVPRRQPHREVRVTAVLLHVVQVQVQVRVRVRVQVRARARPAIRLRELAEVRLLLPLLLPPASPRALLLLERGLHLRLRRAEARLLHPQLLLLLAPERARVLVVVGWRGGEARREGGWADRRVRAARRAR